MDYMNIALIAHDAKKKLMQNFCIAYRGILSKNELYATGNHDSLNRKTAELNCQIVMWKNCLQIICTQISF